MDYSSLYDYSTYSTQSSQGGGSPIVSLVMTVLSVIGLWKVFTKAGEQGWKAIIPIYNAYILFKIAGRNFWKYFVLALVLTIAMFVAMFGALGAGFSAMSNSSSAAGGLGIVSVIALIVVFVCAIWCIVEQALLCGALSRKFGHGTGFAVGLFFLSPIFLMILGFNSDEYQGEKPAEPQEEVING